MRGFGWWSFLVVVHIIKIKDIKQVIYYKYIGKKYPFFIILGVLRRASGGVWGKSQGEQEWAGLVAHLPKQ